MENLSSWMAGHELHTKKFSLIGKTDDIICSKKKVVVYSREILPPPSHFAGGQEATIQLNIPHCVVSSLCVNEAT